MPIFARDDLTFFPGVVNPQLFPFITDWSGTPETIFINDGATAAIAAINLNFVPRGDLRISVLFDGYKLTERNGITTPAPEAYGGVFLQYETYYSETDSWHAKSFFEYVEQLPDAILRDSYGSEFSFYQIDLPEDLLLDNDHRLIMYVDASDVDLVLDPDFVAPLITMDEYFIQEGYSSLADLLAAPEVDIDLITSLTEEYENLFLSYTYDGVPERVLVTTGIPNGQRAATWGNDWLEERGTGEQTEEQKINEYFESQFFEPAQFEQTDPSDDFTNMAYQFSSPTFKLYTFHDPLTQGDWQAGYGVPDDSPFIAKESGTSGGAGILASVSDDIVGATFEAVRLRAGQTAVGSILGVGAVVQDFKNFQAALRTAVDNLLDKLGRALNGEDIDLDALGNDTSLSVISGSSFTGANTFFEVAQKTSLSISYSQSLYSYSGQPEQWRDVTVQTQAGDGERDITFTHQLIPEDILAYNTTYLGAATADKVSTSIGNDVIYGFTGNDTVHSGSGADTVFGGDGRDRLYGEGQNDQLFGGDGDDILLGGGGDDTLTGGAGDDIIDGGYEDGVAEHDLAIFDVALGDTEVSFEIGRFTIVSDLGTDTVTNVETFQFAGSTFSADEMELIAANTAPTSSLPESLYSLERMDVDLSVYFSDAEGHALTYSIEYLPDGAILDTATGIISNVPEIGPYSLDITVTDIYGAEVSVSAGWYIENVNDAPVGNVEIIGSAVEDATLTADTGNLSDADGLGTLSYQWLSDGRVIAGATTVSYTLGQNDVGSQISVQVNYIDDQGTAESVNSDIINIIDPYLGDTSANTIIGNEQSNTIRGLAGNDVLIGKGGHDFIYGNRGFDTLDGNFGNDRLFGGLGKDVIRGGNGFDRLFGGGWNDRLEGGKGNDRLFGQVGNDILNGGKGRDFLVGGLGLDKFVFKVGYGKDTIRDFQDDVDTLRLDRDLWSGSLNKQQVVNQYAQVIGDDIVFDFGTDELTLKGFTNLSELRDDITFI